MPRVLRIINRFNLGGPTHNAAYLTRYLPGEFETLLVGGAQEQSEEGSGHILKNLGVEPMILPEITSDPTLYPPPEVAAKLWTFTVVPPKVAEQYTRIWTDLKTGR